MGCTFSGMTTRVIVVLTVTCLLMCTDAVPKCRKRLEFDQVGLCSANGLVSVWDCASCQPGLGQSVECGRIYKAGTELGCKQCKNGSTYSDTYDISQCKQCTQCAKNEVQTGHCLADKDTIRCTCKPGYYRDTWTRDCKPCSWCCGDGSNKRVPECKNLEKKCSLQFAKSCSPTTPAPTTVISTTAAIPSTYPDTTEKSPSTSSVPKTTETTTVTKNDKTKLNSLISTKTLNDEESSKDPPKGKSEYKELLKIILWPVSAVLALFTLLLLCFYFLHWKRKGSCSSNTGSSSAGLERNQGPDRPLLQTNGNDNGSGSGSGEHVHLDPNAASAAYHVGCHQDRPLLQTNDNDDGSGSGSGSGEHVHLDPNAASAVHHVGSHQGSNEVQPSKATRRLDEQKLSFISVKLGKRIKDLKHDVIQTLCRMLKVQIDGKDYRNLDLFCKLDYYEKKGLEKHDNPMECIIEIMVSNSITLESFLNELYEISRGDVVEKLYDMATKVGSTHER